MASVPEPRWWVVSATTRGAAHKRDGLPNQDHYRCEWTDDRHQAVLTVADGHGSPLSFRSHIGADLAVNAAVKESRGFLEHLPPEPGTGLPMGDDRRRELEVELHRLALFIISRWREGVRDDHKRRPFTEDELSQVAKARGQDVLRQLEKDPELAYGSTLIAALATPTFLAFLQLGDGDIVVVEADGSATRPIGRDPRLLANETTSLSMRGAQDAVHINLRPLVGPAATEEPPELVLLATDGYANSYESDAAFAAVAVDYDRQLHADGIEAVAGKMKDWLAEVSKEGSGDDVTAALLWREPLDAGKPAPDDGETQARPTHEESGQEEDGMGDSYNVGDVHGKNVIVGQGGRIVDNSSTADQEALLSLVRELAERVAVHGGHLPADLPETVAELEDELRREEPHPGFVRRLLDHLTAGASGVSAAAEAVDKVRQALGGLLG